MRGLIYYRINQDDLTNVGVLKKCLAQTEAFKTLGVEIDLVILSHKGIRLNDKIIYKFRKPILSKAYSKYWFYLFKIMPLLTKRLNLKSYNFIYFRYALAHLGLIHFLKNAKKKNTNLKIIAEFPTYPYEQEKRNLMDRLSLLIDQYYRKKLKYYLDGITHYGIGSNIFGIPTIPISNGVAVDKINISTSQPQNKKLRLIAVANWSYWHGLDRLLEGLKNFYKKNNANFSIILTIIGYGRAIAQYKNLVRKYNLEDSVMFLPPTKNNELDDHFNQADMGIGTLGIHRKNIKIDSSLKHREYAARGLPFLLAGTDLDFPDHLSFIMKATETEEAIDVNQLIIFWEKFIKSDSMRREAIRKYAEDHLGWEKRMKKVIAFLNKK